MSIQLFAQEKSHTFANERAEFETETAGAFFFGSAFDGEVASSLRGKVKFLAIELNSECLSEHIGLEHDESFERVIGFARFRMGTAQPTNLIELVKQPWTDVVAIEAAKASFEKAGFVVAVCNDVPGRIVNRLIRPYFNAVLRRLDDGLASAEHMDLTLRLGLGYPEGPLELLKRTGLEHHYDVTQSLFEAFGDIDFAPARRARIAKVRAGGVHE